jgi:hypothetical protein
MSKASFFVETRWGGSESAPSIQRMRELIAELSVPDEEHPDTWLVHGASGWLLRLDEDRYAYLEDSDCNIISHMQEVPPEHALQLWIRFSVNGRDAVLNEAWVNGKRYVSPEELATRKARAEQLTLQSDRKFYDQLGSEYHDVKCKMENCTRGHIQYSTQCRIHHFEQIRGRKCPFNE